MIGKIVHWVPDTDMRNCHHGLGEIAKKELRVRVSELAPGDCILFTNAAWTAFKVLDAFGNMLHHRAPDGQRLNPKAVLISPHFASGGDIGYSRALKHEITAYAKEHGYLEQPAMN